MPIFKLCEMPAKFQINPSKTVLEFAHCLKKNDT